MARCEDFDSTDVHGASAWCTTSIRGPKSLSENRRKAPWYNPAVNAGEVRRLQSNRRVRVRDVTYVRRSHPHALRLGIAYSMQRNHTTVGRDSPGSAGRPARLVALVLVQQAWVAGTSGGLDVSLARVG